LGEALARVRSLNLEEPEDIKVRLLDIIRESNYVPPGSEKSYEEALYREYRRSAGESVQDDSPVLEILILGPGCPRCDELHGRVMTVAAEMGLAADIRQVKDLKEMADYGPVSTPALVVNRRVKLMGRVPSKEELRDMLS
jgi:small redox-active disulfide protein 2